MELVQQEMMKDELDASYQPTDKQICRQHKNSNVCYINMNKHANSVVCNKCIIQNNLSGEQLIPFCDIIQNNESDIVACWPILETTQINAQLASIIYDSSPEIPNCLLVEEFFASFKKTIQERTEICQKKILSDADKFFFSRSQLKSKNDEISKRDILKEKVEQLKDNNPNSIEELETFVNEMKQNHKENTKQIQESISFCQLTQKALQFEIPKIYLNSIIKLVDLTEKWFEECAIEKKGQKTEGSQGDNSNNTNDGSRVVKEIIDLVNNKTNFCQNEFIEQLQQRLQDMECLFADLSTSFYNEGKKPIDFASISPIQMNNLEMQIKSLSLLSQLNNQNNFEDFQKNSAIFELLDSTKKDLDITLKKISENENININQLKQKHNYELNLTQICTFVKSKQDEYSQTHQEIDRNPQDLSVRITQIESGWSTQFFYDQKINPLKKYIMQVQFSPFQDRLQNYKYYIGVTLKQNVDTIWLSNQSFYFSNIASKNITVKKGQDLSESDLKYSEIGRRVEVQLCLQDKHFVIADYPKYENVLQITPSQLEINSTSDYRLGILLSSIECVNILHFAEVSIFNLFENVNL